MTREYLISEAMETVQANFPHRDTQIDLLWKLLCHDKANEMVHVFGIPATGKTSVVRALLESSQTPHVYINCHECSSVRSLFERILFDISHVDLSIHSAPSTKKPRKIRAPKESDVSLECRNGAQFVENYKIVCSKLVENGKHPAIIVVLDNIERTCRYSDGTPLPVLTRMSEYADEANRLILVTISDLPWTKLFSGGRHSCSGQSPLQIAFPGYSMDESMDIFEKMNPDCAADKKRPYRQFLKTALDIFFPSCRDILELNHQVQRLYEKWDGKPLSITAVWTAISQTAAKQLDELFLRNTGNGSHDMTKTSKYLLVAAFCASFNPKKTDKLFFLKHHGKEKVQTPHSKRRTRGQRSCLVSGPKLFPLERLLAIYRCLTKDDDDLRESRGFNITDQLLTQVTSLVNEGLLQSTSAATMLGVPKYKCLGDKELVEEVARSIDIELNQRLFDIVNE